MGNLEIPHWLKGLPLAPEFRPTDTEFSDPVAYISKIEKEASAFGICKIVPPLPKPSKRYVFSNLKKSLLKCPELGADVISSSNVSNSLKVGSGVSCIDGEARAVFTTRHQELGQSMKRTKGAFQNPYSGVHKQVWQSGEVYTLEQFESKSKAFARSVLGIFKEVTPLGIEALFWKASSEKPIYVEYANDVPGSAFGELEGQVRFIHRRRRKRAFFQRNKDTSDCKKHGLDKMYSSKTEDAIGASVKDVPNTCIEKNKSLGTSSAFSSNETSQSSEPKSSNVNNEMEGSAGWKLSNSPWNLQVIARSPGSLTRFMPDDIPGVTSPMIYIGMLFSWFAWHVEDHELHSMNFLHTGSAKTWYAVPGDYAFTFEEVIRTEAYGSNVDYLAALTLLGEKTTLLSPEVVVASGIPCYRLVQNPGEFVVTFPRAYHVGFSHEANCLIYGYITRMVDRREKLVEGFNCGEAANFGTPQWLKVAKEAAVRRAAMNYLPMLSHQQLLYLLTMSFVSRVPRSLLPGVRSSRLRDRQKEEREASVKNAFMEDMLHDNNLLSALLRKGSAYHAVLWNAYLLPVSTNESNLVHVAAIGESCVDNLSNINSNANGTRNCLFDELCLYMENLNDLYLGDDDLRCDFQIDSGTLACVGCGILGFPFMAVVQPSEGASMELLPSDCMALEVLPLSEPGSSLDSDESLQGNHLSVSDLSSVENKSMRLSKSKFNRGWDTSTKFLRPRIFCLEHAIEIVELLQGKGGVNVLVICHSDFQKIKAHAMAISEEIGHSFNYNEVSLEFASQEELNLIDLAIDGQEHDECGEDWTSKLGINLRYCVNARKNSLSMQVKHGLRLNGLPCDKGSDLEAMPFHWKSRRSRSRKLNHPSRIGACNSIQIKDNVAEEGSVGSAVKKEMVIQYSRRKFKSKPGSSRGASEVHEHCRKYQLEDLSAVTSEDQYNNQSGKELSNVGNFGSNYAQSDISRISGTGIAEWQHDVQTPEVAKGNSLNSASELANLETTPLSENVEAQANVKSQHELETDDEDMLTESHSKIQHDINPPKVYSLESEISQPEICDDKHATFRGDQFMDVNDIKNESCSFVLNNELHQEVASSSVSLANQSTCTSMHKSIEGPGKAFTMEDIIDEKNELEINITNGIEEDHMSRNGIEIIEHTPTEKSSCIIREFCDVVDMDNVEVRQEFQTTEQHVSNSDQPDEENQATCILVEHCQEFSRGSSLEYLVSTVSPETKMQGEFHIKNGNNEDPSPIFVEGREAETMPISEEVVSEVQRDASVNEVGGNEILGESIQQEGRKYEELYSGTKSLKKDSTDLKDQEGASLCLTEDNCEHEIMDLNLPTPRLNTDKRKRKREVKQSLDSSFDCNGFIRSPCEGLRPRGVKVTSSKTEINIRTPEKNLVQKKADRTLDVSAPRKNAKVRTEGTHRCDIEGCNMSFMTKAALLLHKSNLCPLEGCGKRFSSHKYAVIHQRVHDDNRPLKCPWKGCTMTFKWAWARTEHIRVHTGEKPYQCKVEGCGLSFRFVSDFSRHRRKTGHYVNSPA